MSTRKQPPKSGGVNSRRPKVLKQNNRQELPTPSSAPTEYIFEEIDGLPIPRIPGVDGVPAAPDGKEFFSLADSIKHFEMTEAALRELWQACKIKADNTSCTPHARKMIFEDVEGIPMPRERGQGKRFFKMDLAVIHFKASEPVLRELYEAVFGAEPTPRRITESEIAAEAVRLSEVAGQMIADYWTLMERIGGRAMGSKFAWSLRWLKENVWMFTGMAVCEGLAEIRRGRVGNGGGSDDFFVKDETVTGAEGRGDAS